MGALRNVLCSLVLDPAAPFIDRAGYLRYIDEAEQRFRKAVAAQRR